MSFLEHVQDPRRLHGLRVRQRTKQALHQFFQNRDYLEVDTPLLVRSPGMEPHIRPFTVMTGAHLPTSPEFAMKKLLAGGLTKIYQLAPSFRNEPPSITHQPEFTMLEFYRAFVDMETFMTEVEDCLRFVAQTVSQDSRFREPFERRSFRDWFLLGTALDLVEFPTLDTLKIASQALLKSHGLSVANIATWDDLVALLWLNFVEPKLPQDRPSFVYHYPASQAALARKVVDEHGHFWARRFEVYLGSMELGNAFEELLDPEEQRDRFMKDMKLREETYGEDFPPSPVDEEFLRALEEGLPPCAGIAIGFDRLIMCLAKEEDIRFTRWLVPDTGKA
jgi:lysyl-tRNA synthetase class 2